MPAQAASAPYRSVRRAAAGLPHPTAALPVLTGADFTARFDFGLGLLVQGLRALRPAGSGPAA
ncbi:hypothetical protein [Streptomyces sp. NPDC051704]|uniref:hypothetical protein n=1 Tax=Streptomyces sp. NPDC051704 TaxID=3365671 RepID=UPI0037A90384